jgi:hypothetical protein
MTNSTTKSVKLLLALLFLAGAPTAKALAAQRDDCAASPRLTCTLVDDPDGARSQIDGLAAIAKAYRSICIRAYYGGTDTYLSKILAYRWTNRIRAAPTREGVPADSIARELRRSADTDSAVAQVTLGP